MPGAGFNWELILLLREVGKMKKNIFLIMTFFLGCAIPDFSPQLSMTEVHVGNKIIYVKREVRGFNYDIWGISQNSDPCVAPSEDEDYIISGAIGKIYIREIGEKIQVAGGTEFQSPHANHWLQSIEEFKVHPLDWKEFEVEFHKKNFQKIDGEKGNMRKCEKTVRQKLGI